MTGYAIGIGRGANRLHAVSEAAAAVNIRHGRYSTGECGATVVIAQDWGGFARGNPTSRLAGHRVCGRCAWTVAFAGGAAGIEEEMAALAPTDGERLAWATLLPRPGVLVDACRAILARRAADDSDGCAQWANLLGHLCGHRPEVLVPEDCAEQSCEHPDAVGCYAAATVVACPTCSVRAGGWAGEWEGQYEVVVPAPCSVLTAIAATYRVS
jgi:hypothetical protein